MASLKHITTVYANGTIPVHKYKSELTGLTVVIGEVEGPLVNGFFTLGKSLEKSFFFTVYIKKKLFNSFLYLRCSN